MSDTPETEDEIRTPDMPSEYMGESEIVDASFARKLERERNEARKLAEELRGLVSWQEIEPWNFPWDPQDNTRFGNDVRGEGPWVRMVQPDLGIGPDGYRKYGAPRAVEGGNDYAALWQSGSDKWRNDGVSSKIIDRNGKTCMIFD